MLHRLDTVLKDWCSSLRQQSTEHSDATVSHMNGLCRNSILGYVSCSCYTFTTLHSYCTRQYARYPLHRVCTLRWRKTDSRENTLHETSANWLASPPKRVFHAGTADLDIVERRSGWKRWSSDAVHTPWSRPCDAQRFRADEERRPEDSEDRRYFDSEPSWTYHLPFFLIYLQAYIQNHTTNAHSHG
jgi:hypothetical protein